MDLLKDILASKKHNTHYLYKYIKFIKNCQEKNIGYIGYLEKHHICPKANDMFPEFTSFREFPWNCALLTPRQHFIAHWILTKTYYTNSVKVSFNLLRNEKHISKTVSHNKNKIVVKDIVNNISQILVTDSKYISGELVPVSCGWVLTKDINNTIHRVKVTDPRYLSGELVYVRTGETVVKTTTGNQLISTKDSRFLSGELTHVNKGKIVCKNAEGGFFSVNSNDPRLLSGEFVGIRKNIPANNRKLTTEQVVEIRKAQKYQTITFSADYLVKLCKKSDRNKIGKVDISELNYSNGQPITYNSLLAKYYVDKFNMPLNNIKAILNYKTYKEISV